MANLETALAYLESGDWEAAHVIVQEDNSKLGAWGHAIVHLQEGDQSNANYWFRRAARPSVTIDRMDRELAEFRAAVQANRG